MVYYHFHRQLPSDYLIFFQARIRAIPRVIGGKMDVLKIFIIECLLLYMLWFNFILGSNFIFLCFWVW